MGPERTEDVEAIAKQTELTGFVADVQKLFVRGDLVRREVWTVNNTGGWVNGKEPEIVKWGGISYEEKNGVAVIRYLNDRGKIRLDLQEHDGLTMGVRDKSVVIVQRHFRRGETSMRRYTKEKEGNLIDWAGYFLESLIRRRR